MKMTFLKLFLIRTFKDPNLAEKLANFSEKTRRQLSSAEIMEFVFSKSGHSLALLSAAAALVADSFLVSCCLTCG